MIFPLTLAIEIDAATVNWLIGLACAALTAIGGALWRYSSMFIAWIKPQVEGVFSSHQTLVQTMNTYIPVVKQQLDDLHDGQIEHSDKLDKHAEILGEHGQKLEQILTKIQPAKDGQ